MILIGTCVFWYLLRVLGLLLFSLANIWSLLLGAYLCTQVYARTVMRLVLCFLLGLALYVFLGMRITVAVPILLMEFLLSFQVFFRCALMTLRRSFLWVRRNLSYPIELFMNLPLSGPLQGLRVIFIISLLLLLLLRSLTIPLRFIQLLLHLNFQLLLLILLLLLLRLWFTQGWVLRVASKTAVLALGPGGISL